MEIQSEQDTDILNNLRDNIKKEIDTCWLSVCDTGGINYNSVNGAYIKMIISQSIINVLKISKENRDEREKESMH